MVIYQDASGASVPHFFQEAWLKPRKGTASSNLYQVCIKIFISGGAAGAKSGFRKSPEYY